MWTTYIDVDGVSDVASPTKTDQRTQTWRNGETVEERRDPELSANELLVITSVCLGLKNRQIADLLPVTDKGVKEHLESIFDKLSVSDRLELVIYAFGHGLAPSNQLE